MRESIDWDDFFGPNAGYAAELYERFEDDPSSVDPETRALFERLPPGGLPASAPPSPSGQPGDLPTDPWAVLKVVAAARLARSIREYGHLAADIDPLGAPRPGDPMLDGATHNISDAELARLPASIVWPAAGRDAGSCLDAINRLRHIYCGHLGYEFDQVQDFEERAWLHESVEAGTFRSPLSPEGKIALLKRLAEVDGFERYLHTVFVGQKRFSVEGVDTLVPVLDEVIRDAAAVGTEEVLIGMAHRGRLNVLAHILDKPYSAIFAEFHSTAGADGQHEEEPEGDPGWTGDVKYHLGAQREMRPGDHGVCVTLADNPSHLEFVDPVVEGFARAAQDHRSRPGAPGHTISRALAVTIHGDAAFPGEGVVAETLNLSRLAGYNTGGSLRIIANNQIGFTTGANDARSTLYASDLAKGFEIPVLHVNGDDPEACLYAARLAVAYRNRFHRDFLIDLIGYRRWGHNEGDEPSFTQPVLYNRIAQHPRVVDLYAEKLIADGIITDEEFGRIKAEIRERLEAAREAPDEHTQVQRVRRLQPHRSAADVATAVPVEELRRLNDSLLDVEPDFARHAKLDRPLRARREALQGKGRIDWAAGEVLAFASILADGTPIRLTGQDSERGTFSQRHLVLHDPGSGALLNSLQLIPEAKASFAVHNSPLSEAAALAFEYGYSVHAPDALVLWEAQFGDFANAAQVIIDQFLVSARAKWRQSPALVLLLPHGYEGQGPEHSSARLERYLQLAAENNIRIVNCTTSAQYFHVLRLQAALLGSDRRPLIVMTPKSLLRHRLAGASLEELSEGSFQTILPLFGDPDKRAEIERLILCSGKVAIDLLGLVQDRGTPARTAATRVEQLYPFPLEGLDQAIGAYPRLREVIWLQEEPANMGAWSFVRPRLESLLSDNVSLGYAGRPERASTAEGSAEAHAREQRRLLEAALGSRSDIEIETRGVHHAS